MEKHKITGTELRKNYGIFGLGIIQIVGLILILTVIVTIAYQVIK